MSTEPSGARGSERDPLREALLHPLALVGLVAGLLLFPLVKGLGALAIGLVLYLGIAGTILLAPSRSPCPRGRRAGIVRGLDGEVRDHVLDILRLENDIRRLLRAGSAEVKRAVAPAVDEVSDLTERALRLAQSRQRAVNYLRGADVPRIEEERDELIRRRDAEDDAVVRRQLEEALASVDRRLKDLDDLQRSAARSEAALVNIQATLSGLHTRVLRFATSDNGTATRDREELAREIDALRATAVALEEIMDADEIPPDHLLHEGQD